MKYNDFLSDAARKAILGYDLLTWLDRQARRRRTGVSGWDGCAEGSPPDL
jgi:hypothetical protein